MNSHLTALNIKDEPRWRHALRAEAARRYSALPDPDFRYGLGVFFNPKLIALPYDGRTGSGEISPRVDGSGDGVKIMKFSEAWADEKYERILRRHLSEEKLDDKIDAWRAANCIDGLLILADAGAAPQSPISIDYDQKEGLAFNAVLVVAEPNSAISIVERRSGDIVSGVEISAGEGARVDYACIKESRGEIDFLRRAARLEARASLVWHDCDLGGGFARARTQTRLMGEGSSVTSRYESLGSGDARRDVQDKVEHLASRTASDIVARIALAGSAKTVYRGLTKIAQGTRGCRGFQNERTLLLSPDAESDAVPELEIAASDVMCGHSAAAGRIDREQLFYLMSRGLDASAAVRAIVAGFFARPRNQAAPKTISSLIEDALRRKMDGLKL